MPVRSTTASFARTHFRRTPWPRRVQTGALVSPFKLRDVYRPQWAGLTARAEAELAVETLLDAGWLEAEDVIGAVGRPTVDYHINPKCKGGAT